MNNHMKLMINNHMKVMINNHSNHSTGTALINDQSFHLDQPFRAKNVHSILFALLELDLICSDFQEKVGYRTSLQSVQRDLK